MFTENQIKRWNKKAKTGGNRSGVTRKIMQLAHACKSFNQPMFPGTVAAAIYGRDTMPNRKKAHSMIRTLVQAGKLKRANGAIYLP